MKKERDFLSLLLTLTLAWEGCWSAWPAASAAPALCCPPLRLADRLLLGDPALFAGRDEPAFAPNSAEYLAARHFLAEALEQRALRFSGP